MAERLKAPASTPAVDAGVAPTVSEMLLAPTFVETPLTRPFLAVPPERAAIVAQIPLGRLASAEEVAAAAVFAASPAASLMTGTSLRVDGGWTAR